MSQHITLILFLFALGACIGSFLNVVVWRLPRGESLVSPPSHCPKCNTPLAWYDNIPVFGWMALRGKCRYCKEPISSRYPTVEAITGLLFVFYYIAFFIWQIGPCAPVPSHRMDEIDGSIITMNLPRIIQLDWPLFALDLFLIACLLAASLIDAELFIIPLEIPWLAAVVGIVIHTLVDRRTLPGALSVGAFGGVVAAGGAAGLIVSMVMYRFKLIQQSFPKGEPLLEIDREQIRLEIEEAKKAGKALDYEVPPAYSRWDIRREIGKEMLFLCPPMVCAGALAAVYQVSPGFASTWSHIMAHDWVGGLLGAVLGALIGAFTIWITRILGTLFFGRVAMGLGDVHLMLGIGAIIGAGASTIVFFIAPFFAMVIALPGVAARLLWWFRRSYRQRIPRGLYRFVLWFIRKFARTELPYGPYLSLATAVVLLCYCPIAAYLSPGLDGLMVILQNVFGGGAAPR